MGRVGGIEIVLCPPRAGREIQAVCEITRWRLGKSHTKTLSHMGPTRLLALVHAKRSGMNVRDNGNSRISKFRGRV